MIQVSTLTNAANVLMNIATDPQLQTHLTATVRAAVRDATIAVENLVKSGQPAKMTTTKLINEVDERLMLVEYVADSMRAPSGWLQTPVLAPTALRRASHDVATSVEAAAI